MTIQTNDIQTDEEYMKEVLAELGIDMSKPRRHSRLPRNEIGIHVIGGAGRPMSISDWEWEEYGMYR